MTLDPETIRRLPLYLEDDLIPALESALEMVRHWSDYAEPYFQKKHALAADIAFLSGHVAQAKKVLAGEDGLSHYDQ